MMRRGPIHHLHRRRRAPAPRFFTALLLAVVSMRATPNIAFSGPPEEPSRAAARPGADPPETLPNNRKEEEAAASLSDREAVIRDRVSRLEDRLFQLSRALRKSDPEKAGRLLEGLAELRGNRIRETLDGIVEKLRREAFSDALDEQRAVSQELQALLKLLLEDPSRLDDRKEEIDRLEALRKALEGIIAEQETEKAQAERARSAMQRAEALEAAARKLEDLIRRQQQAAEKTARGEGSPGACAGAQAAIRGETEALSREVKDIAEAQAQAGPDASATGETPADRESPDAPSGTDAEQAGRDLDRASEKMESAEKHLRSGDAEAAKPEQQDAAKALETALQRLETETKKIRNRLELEEQSAEQRETAEKTQRLSKDMQAPEADGSKQAGEGPQEGGSGDPQQGGENSGSPDSDESGEPAPGREGVQQAVPHQEDAARNLEAKEPDKAVKNQEKALEQLKRAKDDLEDRLDQLRREQQEELLTALESRFRAMLGRQVEINKATGRLAELGPDHWKRSDQLELAELSQKQRWVGDQAEEALQVLVEEGSTVILPRLVEQARDDARSVAERLAAAEAGESVRGMQSDLEQILRDIIDAIKQQQDDLEQGEGGGGGEGNSPLLPGSAELKLLRACQLRVNAATERIQARLHETAGTDASVGKSLQRLSRRQAEVAEMAKDMHEALKRAQ